MENLPKNGPFFREFGAQKPTHMGGTYPYPQHVMYPPGGIDFHDFGIRNGINFRNFHNWYSVGYAFSENWYKVGYTFLKNWYKVRYTFRKN